MLVVWSIYFGYWIVGIRTGPIERPKLYIPLFSMVKYYKHSNQHQNCKIYLWLTLILISTLTLNLTLTLTLVLLFCWNWLWFWRSFISLKISKKELVFFHSFWYNLSSGNYPQIWYKTLLMQKEFWNYKPSKIYP